MKKIPKSKEEALRMTEKRNAKYEKGDEAHLQCDIVVAFSDKHPEMRGRLFATFQNADNNVTGALNVSMGMVRGVSDLLYSNSQRKLIGLEVKHPEYKHERNHVLEQCDFIDNVCEDGFFITSVEAFWDAINNHRGIGTAEVREHLKTRKTIQFKDLL